MKTNDITTILNQLDSSNPKVSEEVYSILYKELKITAKSVRNRWNGNDTLNTTALVHETFLKLIPEEIDWQNRCHFFFIAGKAMRQILCNYAEKKNAQKRKASQAALDVEDFKDVIPLKDRTIIEILCLENLLKRLESEDALYGQVIECRFYGDMTIKETAEILKISEATVKRKWNFARAYLFKEIKEAS
jgi:RNA polymerase sigma factor (TIGR02999 family)